MSSPPASDYSALICEAAKQAEQLFKRCNLPLPASPARIGTVDQLEPGCLGQYPCGGGWIEVLALPALAASGRSESAFTFLPIDESFRSVLVHELTHAAFDTAPCPFAACITAAEYDACVMQVMFLTPVAQAMVTQSTDPNQQISRDDLSLVMLSMAPNRFARKAWVHFTQRDDPGGFIGQFTDGKTLLDRERFGAPPARSHRRQNPSAPRATRPAPRRHRPADNS